MALSRASSPVFSYLVPNSRVDASTPPTIGTATVPGTPAPGIASAFSGPSIIDLALLHVPANATLNSVTIRNGDTGWSAGAGTTSSANIGIYNQNEGLPANLLFSQTFSLNRNSGSNTFQPFPLTSNLPLTPGYYWVAFQPLDSNAYNLAGILASSTENRHSTESLVFQKMIGQSSGQTSTILGLSAAPDTASPNSLPTTLATRTLNYAFTDPTSTLMRLRGNAIYFRFGYVD